MVEDREKNRGPASSVVGARAASLLPTSSLSNLASARPPPTCVGAQDDRRAAAEASNSKNGAAEEGRSGCDGDATVIEETDDEGEGGGKRRLLAFVGLLPFGVRVFLRSKAGVMAPLRDGGRGEGEGNIRSRGDKKGRESEPEYASESTLKGEGEGNERAIKVTDPDPCHRERRSKSPRSCRDRGGWNSAELLLTCGEAELIAAFVHSPPTFKCWRTLDCKWALRCCRRRKCWYHVHLWQSSPRRASPSRSAK